MKNPLADQVFFRMMMLKPWKMTTARLASLTAFLFAMIGYREASGFWLSALWLCAELLFFWIYIDLVEATGARDMMLRAWNAQKGEPIVVLFGCDAEGKATHITMIEETNNG